MADEMERGMGSEESEHGGSEGAGSRNGHGEKSRLMAGTVTAEHVKVNGVVGYTHSEQDATVKGASGAVVAGNDATVTGGAGAFVARGGMTIVGGGGPVMVSGGPLDVSKGGGALLVARKAVVRDNGFIGIALSRKVKVKEGGRVLITALPAVLMGAAMGLAFALVSELVRSATTPSRPWRKSPAEKAAADVERRARMLLRRGERLAGRSRRSAERGARQVRAKSRGLVASLRS